MSENADITKLGRMLERLERFKERRRAKSAPIASPAEALKNGFIPIDPTERQRVFLMSTKQESLYGGAARGGKTVALLAGGLMYVHIPGYRALILRRSFSDLNLPESLIPMSHQWLGGKPGVRWNGKLNEWTFPSGATLTFGYLEHENDKYRYQGAELQFIGFDELTQFTSSQYTYLFSRLVRKAGVEIPVRMRAASNPGGTGHVWVKKRFMEEQDSGREFISAKLEHNPHVDQTAYLQSLSKLDPITRQQLQNGDWDAFRAGVFRKEWFRYWRLDRTFYRLLADGADKLVSPGECTRFLCADIAGVEKRSPGHDPDYSVAQVWDIAPDGDMILVAQWRAQAATTKTEEQISSMARRYKVPYVLVEHAHVGIGVIQHLQQQGIAVSGIPAHRSKLVRSQTAQIRMEAHSVYFPADESWVNEDLEPELLRFTGSGDDSHDDQSDVVAYSAMHVSQMGFGSASQSAYVDLGPENRSVIDRVAGPCGGISISEQDEQQFNRLLRSI